MITVSGGLRQNRLQFFFLKILFAIRPEAEAARDQPGAFIILSHGTHIHHVTASSNGAIASRTRSTEITISGSPHEKSAPSGSHNILPFRTACGKTMVRRRDGLQTSGRGGEGRRRERGGHQRSSRPRRCAEKGTRGQDEGSPGVESASNMHPSSPLRQTRRQATALTKSPPS
jgi:hypothetical protein